MRVRSHSVAANQIFLEANLNWEFWIEGAAVSPPITLNYARWIDVNMLVTFLG